MSLAMSLISALRSTRGDSWTTTLAESAGSVARGRLTGASNRSADELTSRSGLAHRAVWMVPEDALAQGWRTDRDGDPGGSQDVTRDIDARLDVESAMLQGGGLSRQHGGAWLWPVVSAHPDAWRRPAGEGPHEVSALHVLTADEVTPVKWETDPARPGCFRPSSVNIAVSRDGMNMSHGGIDTSWLIYVPGASCSPTQPGRKRGYDLSMLQLYREAVCDYDSGGRSIARLMERLAYFFVQLKGAEGGVTGGSSADYNAAIELLKEGMTTAGLMVLLGEDTAGWDGPSLGGIKDAQTSLAERVSAVEGIPLTLLLGQAPGGLGTDGESGRRSYSSLLTRYRRQRAAPVLLRLYDFMFGPDPSRRIEWPPPETPTDTELAAASLTRAQRDAALIMAGVITPDESRSRFTDGEETPLYDIAEDEDDEPDRGEMAEAPPYAGVGPAAASAPERPDVQVLLKLVEGFTGTRDFGMVNAVRRQVAEALGVDYPGDLPEVPLPAVEDAVIGAKSDADGEE